MTIPTLSKINPISAPLGTSDNRLQKQFLTTGNLGRAGHRGKQKRQASADFLGVMAVSQKVVVGCCIPTTIWNRKRPNGASSEGKAAP
jgi:hypothetical protein